MDMITCHGFSFQVETQGFAHADKDRDLCIEAIEAVIGALPADEVALLHAGNMWVDTLDDDGEVVDEWFADAWAAVEMEMHIDYAVRTLLADFRDTSDIIFCLTSVAK
jgi:hypothetical protein